MAEKVILTHSPSVKQYVKENIQKLFLPFRNTHKKMCDTNQMDHISNLKCVLDFCLYINIIHLSCYVFLRYLQAY